jgi:hypothetical protein
VGRLPAVVLLLVGALLLALAGAFALLAVDPAAAAWAAAHATCNRRRCTPEELRLVGWIVGAALGVVGFVMALFGAVQLRRPARPSALGTAWSLLGALQKAAASGQLTAAGGRHVIDARGDPALREAVLSALRAHGIQVDPSAAAPPPAVAALPTPPPGSHAPAAPRAPAALAAPGPHAPAAAPASSRPAGDRLDQLDQLARLREAGVLTAEEYDTLRRRVLTGK